MSSRLDNELDEDFWDDLLPMIEAGKVIPIVGPSVVTMSPEEAPLYPWLAGRLAEKLRVSDSDFGPEPDLGPEPGLNQVVMAHNLQHPSAVNAPYTRLFSILRKECPEPGSLLRSLAGIEAFNLFLTTAIDPLLERALNLERFGGEPHTESVSFLDGGGERKDLPMRKRDLDRPLIYHLFGKASPQPGECVIWAGDALETVIELHNELRSGATLRNLSRDLSEYGMLMIGLSFSNWLVRFFLRVARQQPLSTKVSPAYLADSRAGLSDTDLVMFFGAVTSGVNVVRCCPLAFVDELSRRWREENPRSTSHGKLLPCPVAPEMPRGAVFVSYAREDEEAVRQLVRELQLAGVDVWYDRERLKPGDYWPTELEHEVKKRCSLFLSVISQITEQSSEGYFHRERNWAAERYSGYARGGNRRPFYLSIVIDDTPIPPVNEPPVFLEVQIEQQIDGRITNGFAARVKELQDHINRREG